MAQHGGAAVGASVSIHQLIEERLARIEFQPVIDLRTRRVFAYEGLVRTEIVAFKNPIAMFRAAIEVDRVGELGRMLRQLAIDNCPHHPLFLNIVPQEFTQDFLLQPEDPIYCHGQQVFLEITESVPLHYSDLCNRILSQAREQGVRLAVDDFGAGYSNLAYIADLEPDVVKLDRELIAGLRVESRRFRLVKNVVRLCLDMGAEVVAEGIETEQELEAAMEAGVHYGQGYGLGMPALPPPSFAWPFQDRTPAEVLRADDVSEQPIHCVENEDLVRFLDRRRRLGDARYEVDLNGVLSHILERANAFVPSAAGTIFLDNPAKKFRGESENELIFVACFGESAAKLLGAALPATKGIVGRVYYSGKPYISADPDSDQFFYRGIDEKTKYKTESVICVPLRLEKQVIGAIQLLNRLGRENYDRKDLQLLQIFAQTISSSIVNAVDAQHAQNLAKLDDLTGLYNDRHFHHCLEDHVVQAMEENADCGLLFLDLDHFKGVNDTRGHLVGSSILREVGIIMRTVLAEDAIAARYGGDEFVVIFPKQNLETTVQRAEVLREAIEKYIFSNAADPYDPKNFPALHISGEITCSIGAASLRDVLPQLQESERQDTFHLKNKLLQVADAAMYRAKETGRNRVVSSHPGSS